jgi:hypothetical protein
MRPASALAGLALGLALAGRLGAADPPPDVRAVIVPEAEVRCGPSTSPQMYRTNLLHQGDRVEVVEELKEGGWLAIRPPRGSFSWINTRFLQHVTPHQSNYVVAQDDVPVPVIYGSPFIPDRRPTVAGARLTRGHQVRGLGPALADAEGTWMPIEPPASEVRYIRAENVSRLPAAPTRTTVAASGSFKDGPPAAPPAPPPPPDGDALWRQAEQAERTGRLADAIRLYELAGEANLHVNHARAEAALRRAEWLRQGGNPPSGGSAFYPDREVRPPTPPGDARPAAAPYEGRVYALPTDTGEPATAARLIGSAPASPPGQFCSTPSAAPAAWGAPPAPVGYPSSGPGRLHRSRVGFLLVSDNGRPVYYAAGQPGLDLEPYVDRNVELFGPVAYRNDLRAYFMTVVRVQPLP